MMQAGQYYVGDLCYVLHDEWDEVCELMFRGRKDGGLNQGEFNLKDGRRFAVYKTAYGDGTYFDASSRSYHVDAGVLGCIKLSDVDLKNERNAGSIGGGQVIEFDHDFNTTTDGDNISFGHIRIATGDDDDFNN